MEYDDNGNEINAAYIASGEPMTSAAFVPWLWAYNSPYPVMFKLIYGTCGNGLINFRNYKTADDVIGFQTYQESC